MCNLIRNFAVYDIYHDFDSKKLREKWPVNVINWKLAFSAQGTMLEYHQADFGTDIQT